MKSMTAYANIHRRRGEFDIQIVLRSLNFKHVDVYVHNLPNQNILLEEKIKKEVRKRIRRGKIEVYFFLKAPLISEVHLEEKILAQYIRETKRLAKRHHLADTLNIKDFLALPQVVSWKEKTLDDAFIMSVVRQGLNRLVQFKEKAGRLIQKEMMRNLEKLQANAKKIESLKPRAVENTNEDISEEVALMSFYINKLHKQINSNSDTLKGKAIDFLTQEILRELNAASSKTNDRTLAQFIVESKNYLERIREQAQNVE
jgi:uncharacterized protein (TIGR00255 family)